MLIISKYALKCVLCILSAEAVGSRLVNLTLRIVQFLGNLPEPKSDKFMVVKIQGFHELSGKSLELIILDGYRICLAFEVKYYLEKVARPNDNALHTHTVCITHMQIIMFYEHMYIFIIELKTRICMSWQHI